MSISAANRALVRSIGASQPPLCCFQTSRRAREPSTPNTSRCSSSGCHTAASGAPGAANPGPVRLKGGCQPPLCAFQTPRGAPEPSTPNTSSCSLSGCHTAASGAPGTANPGPVRLKGGCQPPLCAFQTPRTAPEPSTPNTSSCSLSGCHTAARGAPGTANPGPVTGNGGAQAPLFCLNSPHREPSARTTKTSSWLSSGCHTAASGAPGVANPGPVRLNGGCHAPSWAFQITRTAPSEPTTKSSRCSSRSCHTAASGAPGGAIAGPVRSNGDCQAPSLAFHTPRTAPSASTTKTFRCSFSGCQTAATAAVGGS